MSGRGRFVQLRAGSSLTAGLISLFGFDGRGSNPRDRLAAIDSQPPSPDAVHGEFAAAHGVPKRLLAHTKEPGGSG